MYIKLSIAETAIVIPDSLSVLLIYLTAAPEITQQLPANTEANEQTHIKHLHQEDTNRPDEQLTMLSYYIPKQYHYYIDCGTTELETLEDAIRIFLDFYDGKLPEAIAEDGYPKINALVTLFEIALKRARYSHAVHKLTLFKIEDLVEVNLQTSLEPSSFRK